jgi:hypothetical protein
MYNMQEKSLLEPFVNSYIEVSNDERYMNRFIERERSTIDIKI